MWRAAPSALALSLLLVPAAWAQQRHPSLNVEDSYREALADAGAGSFGAAVSRVVVLEQKSSPECLQAIELHTAKQLAGREPESLFAQAFLRVAVRQARYQALEEGRELFDFERVSIIGLRHLGELYVETSRQGDASSMAAGLFTYMAYGVAALRSAPRVDAARRLLEAAVKLDPDHPTALHSLAVALELLGRPVQALPHLDRLLALAPEDPRFRARRAVLTLKAGRLERGERLLEELRTDEPAWARELAIQELARLLSARGRRDEAVALLRQELLERPGEKLYVQLAALLDPRWIESWEVLGPWLSGRQGDAGPSPRWIYEDGAEMEVDALRLELGSARLRSSLPGAQAAGGASRTAGGPAALGRPGRP